MKTTTRNARQRAENSAAKAALPAPTQAEIALCAHAIWESEGRPEGRETEHWVQAETQLRETRREDEVRSLRIQDKFSSRARTPRPPDRSRPGREHALSTTNTTL